MLISRKNKLEAVFQNRGSVVYTGRQVLTLAVRHHSFKPWLDSNENDSVKELSETEAEQ